MTAAVLAAVAVNWLFQAARKPSELLFPVSGTLIKTPPETWRQYSAVFSKFSTDLISPPLLAAIAQVEAEGNPIARTYWRWTWTSKPLEMYRPASSAVGMFQMTDAAFAEASRYCVRNHAVVRQCWFNTLYARVFPGDAAELTSAYLDRQVSRILDRHPLGAESMRRTQELAALVQLCGAAAGEEFAKRGFHLNGKQRCGDHEARVYIARVNRAVREFERLAGES